MINITLDETLPKTKTKSRFKSSKFGSLNQSGKTSNKSTAKPGSRKSTLTWRQFTARDANIDPPHNNWNDQSNDKQIVFSSPEKDSQDNELDNNASTNTHTFEFPSDFKQQFVNGNVTKIKYKKPKKLEKIHLQRQNSAILRRSRLNLHNHANKLRDNELSLMPRSRSSTDIRNDSDITQGASNIQQRTQFTRPQSRGGNNITNRKSRKNSTDTNDSHFYERQTVKKPSPTMKLPNVLQKANKLLNQTQPALKKSDSTIRIRSNHLSQPKRGHGSLSHTKAVTTYSPVHNKSVKSHGNFSKSMQKSLTKLLSNNISEQDLKDAVLSRDKLDRRNKFSKIVANFELNDINFANQSKTRTKLVPQTVSNSIDTDSNHMVSALMTQSRTPSHINTAEVERQAMMEVDFPINEKSNPHKHHTTYTNLHNYNKSNHHSNTTRPSNQNYDRKSRKFRTDKIKSNHRTKSHPAKENSNFQNISASMPSLLSKAPKKMVHAIPDEFDINGDGMQSMVDDWVQQSEYEQYKNSLLKRKQFTSAINYCNFKFNEINSLTYHKKKLHPSRIRVFCGLLKLFLNSISIVHNEYKFAIQMFNDILKCLFINVDETTFENNKNINTNTNNKKYNNKNKSKNKSKHKNEKHSNVNIGSSLSTFQTKSTYMEECQKYEEIILQTENIENLKYFIQQKQNMRDYEIVNDNNNNNKNTNINIETAIHIINQRRPQTQDSNHSSNKSSSPTNDNIATFDSDINTNSGSFNINTKQIGTQRENKAVAKKTAQYTKLLQRFGASEIKWIFSGWRRWTEKMRLANEEAVYKMQLFKVKQNFKAWKSKSIEMALERCNQSLFQSRMKIVNLETELSQSQKHFASEIQGYKQQLDMILSQGDKYGNNEMDSDTKTQAQIRDTLYKWNKLVASLLQHQLQLRKNRITKFIENKDSVDPVSLKTVYFQWGSIRATLGWKHARQSVMFPTNGVLDLDQIQAVRNMIKKTDDSDDSNNDGSDKSGNQDDNSSSNSDKTYDHFDSDDMVPNTDRTTLQISDPNFHNILFNGVEAKLFGNFDNMDEYPASLDDTAVNVGNSGSTTVDDHNLLAPTKGGNSGSRSNNIRNRRAITPEPVLPDTSVDLSVSTTSHTITTDETLDDMRQRKRRQTRRQSIVAINSMVHNDKRTKQYKFLLNLKCDEILLLWVNSIIFEWQMNLEAAITSDDTLSPNINININMHTGIDSNSQSGSNSLSTRNNNNLTTITNNNNNNGSRTKTTTKLSTYQACKHTIGYDNQIGNFSKDLADGKIYTVLLHCLFPSQFSLTTVKESTNARLTQCIQFVNDLKLAPLGLINVEDITRGNSDLNFVFLGCILFNCSKKFDPKPMAFNFQSENNLIKFKDERCGRLYRSSKVRDLTRMKDFIKEIESSLTILDRQYELTLKGALVWKRMQTQVSTEISKKLVARFKNRVILHTDDPIEKEKYQSIFKIPKLWLIDILEVNKKQQALRKREKNNIYGDSFEQCVEQIQSFTLQDKKLCHDYAATMNLLEKHSGQIRFIFDYYCRYSGMSSGMSLVDWIRFVKNANVFENDKKAATRGRKIFTVVAQLHKYFPNGKKDSSNIQVFITSKQQSTSNTSSRKSISMSTVKNISKVTRSTSKSPAKLGKGSKASKNKANSPGDPSSTSPFMFDENNSIDIDFELNVSDFANCLLRLANVQYCIVSGSTKSPKSSSKQNKNQSFKLVTEIQLYQKVQSFFDDHLSNMVRNGQIVEKRCSLIDLNAQQIFQEHKQTLLRIFHWYIRANEHPSDSDGLLSPTSKNKPTQFIRKPLKSDLLQTMIKHAGLAETLYTNNVSFLESINQQVTKIMEKHITINNSSEIVYEEFLEVLAILCHIRNPNPYKSLKDKLPKFLDNYIIKPLMGNILKKQ